LFTNLTALLSGQTLYVTGKPADGSDMRFLGVNGNTKGYEVCVGGLHSSGSG
jgi:hypothetical protein